MSRTTTKIIIRRKNGEVVSQYALGIGEHLIGREADSGIFIEDSHISRQHAKLIISADAIEIEDLDSTSGTFLDGMTVRGRIPVEPGQRVHISDLYLDIERKGFSGLIKGSRLSEGRFTLVEKLGQGGMGAVWKALDEESGAHVALKLLPPEMSSDPSGLRDLEREVDKTKYLDHLNIVQIGGLWHAEDEPAFITVEYVEGNNLDELRSTTSHKLLPWASVQHYMLQLCDALEYAHSQRIAHRDIKPSNLLISHSDELKLADFGIAASIAGTASTFTTEVINAGTPAYMAPQQIEGRRPQASDDIYALGATFYDLLTGTTPFYLGEVIHQVLHVPPTPMEERLKELGAANDIPDYVGVMVMACLQKDPDKRPVSAAAIRKWIESEGKTTSISAGKRVVGGESSDTATTRHFASSSAPPIDSIVKGEGIPQAKRSNALAYGIAAAILAVAVGTAFILHEPGKSGSGKEGKEKSAANKNSAGQAAAAKKVPAPKVAPKGINQTSKVKIGTPIWEFETAGGVDSSPAIGSDGTVYVGSSDTKLYAIKTDSKGPAKSPWPMRGQNARHTGRVPGAIVPVAGNNVPAANAVAWVSDPSNPNNVKIEAAIRKAAKKLPFPIGELTEVDLRKVTILNLVANQLTDVKGLEKLTRLTGLQLSENKLTELPKGLEKLTRLTNLQLGGNQLTDVKGLEKLTQLTELHLTKNQLTDVKSLEKLTRLEFLTLRHNPDLTKAQIDQLQKALPKCKIYSNPIK